MPRVPASIELAAEDGHRRILDSRCGVKKSEYPSQRTSAMGFGRDRTELLFLSVRRSRRLNRFAISMFDTRWLKEKWSVESVLPRPIQPFGQCLSCTLNNLETSSTSGIQSVLVSACFTTQTGTTSGIVIPCFRSARSFRSDIILITRPVIAKPSRAKCSSPL